MATSSWKCILCPENELILNRTLACGQTFRWKEMPPGVWTGIIGKKVWKLKQSETHLFYQVFPEHTEVSKVEAEKEDSKKGVQNQKYLKPSCTDMVVDVSDSRNEIHVDENQSILYDYFQLNVCLTKLYNHWSAVDPNFKAVSSEYPGIRMIRQHPVECLFSFICSSNNAIPRIIQMVDKLCRHYGEKIATIDGEDFYSFPTVSALVGDNVVSTLQRLGFGYRSKYIHESAKFLLNDRDEDWLTSLRQEDYHQAKQQLMQLHGVGAKVADCVCLMSLDKTGAIPVDTHVWKITGDHYMPHLKEKKSVTSKLYDEIGEYFRDLWGEHAGWAHSVLFAADLKTTKVPKVTNSSSGRTTKRKTSSEKLCRSKVKHV